jgi:hypothetical protein
MLRERAAVSTPATAGRVPRSAGDPITCPAHSLRVVLEHLSGLHDESHVLQ